MAFHTGAGFAHFAAKETQIKSVLASVVLSPPSGPQRHISKKKEAKRRQAELQQLQAVAPDQIEFAVPVVEQARETDARLREIEAEMRAAFGLDSTPSAPSPAATSATPSVAALPPPDKPKPRVKASTQIVKRQVEVMLQVARPDGTQVPFYYSDPCVSTLEAELNAAKRARKYGLTVLKTLEVSIAEYAHSA